MTPDDVRAAAEQLVQFHERFAPLFGKEQAQDHAYDYVKGLMTCPERKSIEPIALLVGHGDVSGLQKFINSAPWQYDDVQAELQAAFDDELAPSAAGSPIGVVGVIDESAFAKKGTHSAGVARQHNGRLGKEDNCQVGVFLIGVTPAGSALLDHRLYLPEPWCEDTPEARRGGRRPTSPRASPSSPRRGSPPSWSAASRCSARRTWIGSSPTRSTARRGTSTTRWTNWGRSTSSRCRSRRRSGPADPAACVPAYSGHEGRVPTAPTREGVLSVAAVAAGLPAGAWHALKVREGAVGPLVFEFAAVRVWAMRDRKPGPAGLAADPSVAGGDARGQVLHLQRRRRDAAGGDGPGGLQPIPGRGILRGLQELPGDVAVRDAVVRRLAPPHGVGGGGAPVRDADARAPEKKSAGLTLDRAVRLLEVGAGRGRVAVGDGDRAGGVPREAEQDRQSVT